MKLLADAQFGVSTFFGLCDETAGSEKCGANGLPLTPASIRIIGRFQKLKTLDHPYLCKYLDVSRGKYERMYVISEYHPRNLIRILQRPAAERLSLLPRLAFQLTSALRYLHSHQIVDRYLSLDNLSMDDSGDVQLSQYGLYYVTNFGVDVQFPVGNPYYSAPEMIANAANSNRSGPKVDVWAMGLVLMEVALGQRLIDLWTTKDLEEFYATIFGSSVFDSILERFRSIGNEEITIDDEMKSLIDSCLRSNPSMRPTCDQLLDSEIMRQFTMPVPHKLGLDSVFTHENRAAHVTPQALAYGLDLSDESLTVPLRSRPIDEAYALWRMAGSNVESILKKKGLIKMKPPVCCLPDVAVDEYDVYGREGERNYMTDLTTVHLSYANLLERLESVSIEDYYPVIQLRYPDAIDGDKKNISKEEPADEGVEMSEVDASRLPIVVKERDIGYQLQRMVLFHRLIEAYPYKKSLVWQEAQVDIPPHYRGYVWAILLDVRAGESDVSYRAIDKDTPTPTDRQIEVDIPRCHQYDELLSSPEGHGKFKRILKAWVQTNPQYVYWQGLDSLCAPFLHLHFPYEAVAFACLSNFIPKYLHNFFLKDNSAVIQEYLAVFNHLLAFHDPVLYSHLANIGFYPELYAIPWFLTMFAHVFPLHKLFHLWDTLLLGSNAFPLCVGVSILVQLRTRLLDYGFNECILLFSDMPDVDIERCVIKSVQLFKRTPVSAMFRKHTPPSSALSKKCRGASFSTYDGVDFGGALGMDSLTVLELKRLHFPRMCAHELLILCGLASGQDSRASVLEHGRVVVVDVRGQEEFARGAFPASINIHDPSSIITDKYRLITSSTHYDRLQKCKADDAIFVVMGGKDDTRGVEFATRMVFAGFPRVCLLSRGIDVLRHTNILVVPASVDMN